MGLFDLLTADLIGVMPWPMYIGEIQIKLTSVLSDATTSLETDCDRCSGFVKIQLKIKSNLAISSLINNR